MYDVSQRCRICRFRKLAQIGAAPTVHLKRARDQARLRAHHLPHSRQPGRQSGAVAGLLTKRRQKVHQNIIFCGHVRSSKRFGRRFCRKMFFYINKLLNKFSCNLRSKLARSTLTSPGPIRVLRRVTFYPRPTVY
jgi:hypothetical protein